MCMIWLMLPGGICTIQILHDLTHVPRLVFVRYRSCTASHKGRLGSIDNLDRDLSDLSDLSDRSYLSVLRVKRSGTNLEQH